MPTNREIRKELLKKLGCTPQALSQRSKVIKKNYGPMSTEDAVYVIAHQNHIDLSKYLPKDTVDHVRTLLQQPANRANQQLKTTAKDKRINYIKIDDSLPDVDAMLSTNLVKDAKNMAKLYPVFYILENSLRVVIKNHLENKYGHNWWETQVSDTIKDNVKNRKENESKQPWHGKRGRHDIFYSNFTDLRSIIQKNWGDFKDLFPSQNWICQRLEDLEHPRNIIAHNNPLCNDDIKRIELYFSDWIKLLAQKRELISGKS